MHDVKEPVRRLRLAKETLRPLGDERLASAHGGITITTSLVLSCASIDCSGDSTGGWSCGKIGACC